MIEFNDKDKKFSDNEFITFIDSLVYISKISLEELGFSVRTYNALKRKGYKNLAQILIATDDDLHRIRNLGKYSVAEIRKLCDEFSDEITYHNMLKEAGVAEEKINNFNMDDFLFYLSIVRQSHNRLRIFSFLSIAQDYQDEVIKLTSVSAKLAFIYNILDSSMNKKSEELQTNYKNLKDDYAAICLEYELIKSNNEIYKTQIRNEIKEKLKEEYTKIYEKKLNEITKILENEYKEKLTVQGQKNKIWNDLLEYKDKNKQNIDSELEIYKEQKVQNINTELETYKNKKLQEIQNELNTNISIHIIGRLASQLLQETNSNGLEITKNENSINITYKKG